MLNAVLTKIIGTRNERELKRVSLRYKNNLRFRQHVPRQIKWAHLRPRQKGVSRTISKSASYRCQEPTFFSFIVVTSSSMSMMGCACCFERLAYESKPSLYIHLKKHERCVSSFSPRRHSSSSTRLQIQELSTNHSLPVFASRATAKVLSRASKLRHGLVHTEMFSRTKHSDIRTIRRVLELLHHLLQLRMRSRRVNDPR